MVARNLFVLFVGLLIGGFLSVYFGKELNWDLANYHYYNPFAALAARGTIDHWPLEFVHVHFIPTLDFLTYFLINTFSPKLTMFLLGALHGINIWLLFCIARLTLSMLGKTSSITSFFAFALALLGLYGPTVLPGIGSFQHDNLISLFVLGFIFLQLKSLQLYTLTGKMSYLLLITGSVLLGLGVGGKLTAAIYVVGALLTLFLLPLSFKDKMKWLLCLTVGVSLGVLISSGYWMLMLWKNYHNPFFPLWNAIFRSPDFPFYNWHDVRFMPQGVMQTLFYPFYFSWDGRTNDMPFRDFRFAITYALIILFALLLVKLRIKKQQLAITLASQWLILFFIFSYIIWQSYFSIMRYISVLEMLAPLVIYLLLHQLFKDVITRFAGTVCIFFLILVTMMPASFVRANWYASDYFNVKLPENIKTVRQASVLVPIPAFALNTKPRPQTYLIPSFPRGWQFVGIPFLGKTYRIPAVISKLSQQKNSLYLLSSSEYLPTLYAIADQAGYRKRLGCDEITSDRQRISGEDVMICLVSKK